MTTSRIAARNERRARVAHVLARAVRENEIEAADALRILRHELRRLNTNKALKLPTRSIGAQAVIDRLGPANVPKNGSPDALHSDHVYALTAQTLHDTHTTEAWVDALDRLRTVVCITAAENYALEKIERDGTTGPEKYEAADVRFTTTAPWADAPAT